MYQELADRLTNLLHLQHVPVGLAFLAALPEGVTRTQRRVPSACTFWRLAEQGVFYATAEDHQECPIGVLTMGFPMLADTQQRAQTIVQTMADVAYFSPSEVSSLPVVQKPHQSIVYGRLDQFPGQADVVLCIVETQQAMLIAEAMGNTNWLQTGGQSIFGRPTCAVIPRALNTGTTAMSFGCVGARTYINLTPSELVLTLPASQLADMVERLQTIVAANQALEPFHQGQKAKFTA